MNSIRNLYTQVQKKKMPNPSKPGLIGTKHSHIDMLTASIYFSADIRNYAMIKTIICKGWQVSDWSLSFSLTGWYYMYHIHTFTPMWESGYMYQNMIDFLLTHSNRSRNTYNMNETQINTNTKNMQNTKAKTKSLSLSLSLSHTHTHTQLV